MAEFPFTAEDLEALRQWDTPTICNALEVVAPARRGSGFSVKPIRAAQPSGRTRQDDQAARIGWYEYVATAPMPTVVVLEDLDEIPGTGAFWGEVNSAVHKALGALGVVTSGSIRDLDMLAPGFQLLAGCLGPSHAYVHIVDYGGEVTVHGMPCVHDAVVHADRHGAVVIPHEAVRLLPAAIELGARREKVILDLCRSPDFTLDKLKEALARSAEIH